MEKIIPTDCDGWQSYKLSNRQVIALNGTRKVHIDCLHGCVWITWPDGADRILLKGQSACVQAKGKICIQGLASSTVQVGEINRSVPVPGLNHCRC